MIYVFLAEGFEEIEALAPVDILRRAGLAVCTVGVGAKTITGSHGIPVVCDLLDSEITPDDSLTAVVLPGGKPGTNNLAKSPVVHTFIDYAHAHNKLIAAICAAPSILGQKGLLAGKEATAFPTSQGELSGARLSGDFVVRDGNLITARGMGVSTEFGLALVACLLGDEQARAIKESIQCKTS